VPKRRFRIKAPHWVEAGELASRAIKTPEGWLGLRRDTAGWTIVGSTALTKKNRDIETFYFDVYGLNAETEAEKKAESMYRDQVEAILTEWLEREDLEAERDC
jgi:hypothetical protein